MDVSLLPPVPGVLDVGCRDWLFARAILGVRPLAAVCCIDPDPKISEEIIPGVHFVRKALVGGHKPFAWYQDRGGEANAVVEPGVPMAFAVPAVNIVELSFHFDLVKLDCEMSEFGILETWPGPIATQISVEFHDYFNWERWNDAYFAQLFAGPLKDYEVVQHERFGIGPGNDMGHWDSLLVLKGAR